MQDLPDPMRLPTLPRYGPSQGKSGPFPEGTLVKIASGSEEELKNLSLLLASVSISHVLDRSSASLLVAAEDVERSFHQWRLSAEENADWPLPPPEPVPEHAAWLPTAVPMALLALFFLHTGPWTGASPWFSRGAVDSTAVIAGREWWRLITALTLHADYSHLVGNLLVGGLIIHLLCRLTGYGAAWFLLLLAATLANWCNCILRATPHLSVGFSTAVFAAIGLLCGMQAVHGQRLLARLLTPLGAGIGLLAMLGVGGERTDLGAHLLGLACGLGFGLLYRLSPALRWMRNPLRQHLAFALAAAAILLGWHLAMA